jgi:hypothetical protein
MNRLFIFVMALTLQLGFQFGIGVPRLHAQSNTGLSGATFLGTGMGARPIAMGGAFVAQSGDAFSMYWNPAGTATIQSPEVVMNYASWFLGTRYNYAAAVVPFGAIGNFGASVTLFSSGDILRTTETDPDGELGDQFSTSDLSIQLTYSKALSSVLLIGGSVKYIRQSVYNASASTLAVDVGTLLVVSEKNGLRLGAMLSNFGGKMQLRGTALNIVTSNSGFENGANNLIPAEKTTDEWNIPLAFRTGMAWDALRSTQNKLTLTTDVNIPSDDQRSVSVGMEYGWHDILFLRGGWNSLFVANADDGFTLGLGIKQSLVGVNIKIDYAFQYFNRLNSPQWIGAAIQF